MMEERTGWLHMTRHERRGAFVLLVLIIAIVLTVRFIRTRPVVLYPSEKERMELFEQKVDSIHQKMDSTQQTSKGRKKQVKKERKRAKPKRKSAEPEAPSRRLDPVPQIQ